MASAEEMTPGGDEPGPVEVERTIIGRMPLPRARISQMDRLLAECGLISGPWAVVKRTGGTGLSLVGIKGAESDAAELPEKLD